MNNKVPHPFQSLVMIDFEEKLNKTQCTLFHTSSEMNSFELDGRYPLQIHPCIDGGYAAIFKTGPEVNERQLMR